MWQNFSVEEILERLKTNKQYGLREKEVIFREEQYGKNELKDKKKESIFTKFLKQFNDYMIIILIIASIISAVISFVQGENDYIDSIIIIGIVIFNAILGVIQEAKAEKAIEALKEVFIKTYGMQLSSVKDKKFQAFKNYIGSQYSFMRIHSVMTKSKDPQKAVSDLCLSLIDAGK